MRSISIFGSTGTVGIKALNVAKQKKMQIYALVAKSNYKLLIDQAISVHPKYVCVTDNNAFKIVQEALAGTEITVLPGLEINDLAKESVDILFMSISGSKALEPTFYCLGKVKRLAIASKEAILLGGELLIDKARQLKTEIVPVDSEHNAIFRCLLGESKDAIQDITLTASGGSFVDFEECELEKITPDMALKHPNWNMGAKITIDSSTLINKALEIIEASYLFGFDSKCIKALIHQESIIHGIATYKDSSSKMIAYEPDMIVPISHAITYPDFNTNSLKQICFQDIKRLTFRSPKAWQKRNIELAYQAISEHKVIAFNIANEIAVYKFLHNEIKFNEIYYFILNVLDRSKTEKCTSIEDIKNTIDLCAST